VRVSPPPLPRSPTRAHRSQASALRETWERDGVLRLDFARYTSRRGEGNERLAEVLRMVAAAPVPSEPLLWAAREVVHEPNDPQTEPHVDTFHIAIKMWVYERNVSVVDGPLHVSPGTHRVSAAKIAWMYARSHDNPPGVIREPSMRLADDAHSVESAGGEGCRCCAADGRLSEAGLPSLRPVLPLPDVERTLIIADTSGLHCRGAAAAGVRRTALRPQGLVFDGGMPRRDPFGARGQ
jgi:hypothetical protein